MSKKSPKPKPLPERPKPGAAPTPMHEQIKVSFRHYDLAGDYCLGHCSRDAVHTFMGTLRQLCTMTPQQVREQGGKPGGGKTGLALTAYEDHKVRVTRPAQVSGDLKIQSIRAGGAARIWGVSIERVFYVIWFDPLHKIYIE